MNEFAHELEKGMSTLSDGSYTVNDRSVKDSKGNKVYSWTLVGPYVNNGTITKEENNLSYELE